MKVLVIFYSLDGNTRFVSQKIAEMTNGELFELKLKKEIKARGFLKYIMAGYMSLFNKMPEIITKEKNNLDYDLIFIGTPVWAGNFCPALRTFLNSINLQKRKIALFCTYGLSKGKSLENLKKLLLGNEILGEKGFKEPLTSSDIQKSINEIKNWVFEILNKVG